MAQALHEHPRDVSTGGRGGGRGGRGPSCLPPPRHTTHPPTYARTCCARRNLRAASRYCRESRQPQIISGVSTRYLIRPPTAGTSVRQVRQEAHRGREVAPGINQPHGCMGCACSNNQDQFLQEVLLPCSCSCLDRLSRFSFNRLSADVKLWARVENPVWRSSDTGVTHRGQSLLVIWCTAAWPCPPQSTWMSLTLPRMKVQLLEMATILSALSIRSLVEQHSI